jgi:hypothetical protein
MPTSVRHTPPQVVVQTLARAVPGHPLEIGDYLVLTAPDYQPTAAPLTFVTRDPLRFEDAMAIEAQHRAVDVAWHFTARPDGSTFRELDFFEECHDDRR